MKHLFWAPVAMLGLSACIHDSVNRQSPPEPARQFEPISARQEITRTEGGSTRFGRDRVYLITRMETAYEPRGEWRAVGSSIQQDGSRVRFVELGTGKIVEFTAPHQITPMSSRQSDRVSSMAGDPVGAPSSAGTISGRGTQDYARP